MQSRRWAARGREQVLGKGESEAVVTPSSCPVTGTWSQWDSTSGEGWDVPGCTRALGAGQGLHSEAEERVGMERTGKSSLSVI